MNYILKGRKRAKRLTKIDHFLLSSDLSVNVQYVLMRSLESRPLQLFWWYSQVQTMTLKMTLKFNRLFEVDHMVADPYPEEWFTKKR